MRTLSIQTQPNGFELELPSFGYWMKAGLAFAIGACFAPMTAFLIFILVGGGLGALLAVLGHH